MYSLKIRSRLFLFLTLFSLIIFTNCIPFTGSQSVTPVSAKTETKLVTASLPISSPSSQPATTLPTIHTQAATPTVYLPIVTASPTPQPPSSDLFADNSVIDQFSSIPNSAFNAASNKHITFYHQSTGDGIVYFWAECLAGHLQEVAECSTYAATPEKYTWAHWNWLMWPQPMANALNKMAQFVSLVPSQSSSDIIGMKFCYVDGWNQDFDNYRMGMEQLEAAYPGNVFIWSTSAVWSDPGDACSPTNPFNSCRNIQEFNDKVRTYAAANHKPLYDIASIESNGGACIVAGYEGLCSNYVGADGGGGGHPNALGSVRLAKGFWWLMARLSGWQP